MVRLTRPDLRWRLNRLVVQRPALANIFTERDTHHPSDGLLGFRRQLVDAPDARARWQTANSIAAAAYGLPRHTFWRPERATKPIYLDLHSPLLAAVLLREVRRAATSHVITFSEMYPGPDRLWLPDVEGRRYTSELRLTIADTTLREVTIQ